jgi:signal transduction histidine kinase
MVGEMDAMIAPLVENNNNLFVKEIVGEDIQMYSDLTKVRQVLFNLLSNASKVTENGTITLTVENRLKNGTQSVLFSVADTGIGLSEEQMDKIIANFVQGDSSTTRKYGETGLGLAVTKHFVEMLDGSLEVRSQVGVGTTFSVEIPRVFTEHASASTATVVKIDDDREHLEADRKTTLVLEEEIRGKNAAWFARESDSIPERGSSS